MFVAVSNSIAEASILMNLFFGYFMCFRFDRFSNDFFSICRVIYEVTHWTVFFHIIQWNSGEFIDTVFVHFNDEIEQYYEENKEDEKGKQRIDADMIYRFCILFDEFKHSFILLK